jgi:hypothetical protein
VPDRLLLAQVALHGEFRQVPEVLWYRRYWGLASHARQRAAFFPQGAPAYTYAPWWLTHVAKLTWDLGVLGIGQPEFGRGRGLQTAGLYAWLSIRKGFRRELRRARRWWRRSPLAGHIKRQRRQLHRLSKRLRNHARAVWLIPSRVLSGTRG